MNMNMNINTQKKPLHEQILFALNKSSYTLHSLAQQMNIKLKVLESYIDGSCVPEKKYISKLNKFLNCKLSL